MDPIVDIAFDCLPLRSVTRVDVPLDASPSFRARCEHLQRALDTHAGKNAYFLYNTRCTYHLANSDIESMLRFSFDGTIITDLSDGKAAGADLEIELVAETCGQLPSDVLAWFRRVVERAAMIEFERFISAGRLAETVSRIGSVDSMRDVQDFDSLNL